MIVFGFLLSFYEKFASILIVAIPALGMNSEFCSRGSHSLNGFIQPFIHIALNEQN